MAIAYGVARGTSRAEQTAPAATTKPLPPPPVDEVSSAAAGDYEALLAQARQLDTSRAPLRAWQPLFERFFAAAATDAKTTAATLSALLDLLRPRARKVPNGYGAYFALTEAQLWVAIQRQDRALQCLEEFAREFPQEPVGVVERGLYLVDLLRALGRLDAARDRLDQLEPLMPTGDTTEVLVKRAHLHRTRAEVLRDLGLLAPAFEQIAVAMRLAESAGSRIEVVDARLVECDLLMASERADRALATAQELLAQVEPSERATRAAVLSAIGYAQASLSRSTPELLPKARESLRAAAELADGSLLARVLVKQVDVALRSRDLDEARTFARDGAVRLGIDRPDAVIASPDACELVHLESRILLAAQPADLPALRAQLPRQLRAARWLIDDWVRAKPSRDGIGFLHLATRRQIVATTVALECAAGEDRQQGAEAALRLLLGLQARTSLARVSEAPDCDLATLRAELFDATSGALIYLPANEQSLLLAVDAEAVTVHQLAVDLGLNAAVRNLVHYASSSPVADVQRRELLESSLRQLGEQVAKLVLPDDVRARIAKWRALTVVGADLARDLPFEIVPFDGRHLLGEVCAIAYTPSLAFNVHARRRQRGARVGAPTSLLACTAPSSELAQRHGVERFALPVELFGTLPESLVLRDGAKLADLRELDWQPRGIVHLVAHGVRGSAAQGLGLAFADGVIWQSDLHDMRLAGCVLVSACGASRGVSRPGEGTAMASIAGTLLWQGASAVLVSRNDLVASDHLRLMGDVHRALAKGESLARALQSARASGAGASLWQRVQLGLVQVIGDGHCPR